MCSWACTLLPHVWRWRRWATWRPDTTGVERSASTPSKWSLHFTHSGLSPGFPSYTLSFTRFSQCKTPCKEFEKRWSTTGSTKVNPKFFFVNLFVYFFMFAKVIVKGTRSCRKAYRKSQIMRCFSRDFWSLWSPCWFCYILLRLFLPSESLLITEAGETSSFHHHLSFTGATELLFPLSDIAISGNGGIFARLARNCETWLKHSFWKPFMRGQTMVCLAQHLCTSALTCCWAKQARRS